MTSRKRKSLNNEGKENVSQEADTTSYPQNVSDSSSLHQGANATTSSNGMQQAEVQTPMDNSETAQGALDGSNSSSQVLQLPQYPLPPPLLFREQPKKEGYPCPMPMCGGYSVLTGRACEDCATLLQARAKQNICNNLLNQNNGYDYGLDPCNISMDNILNSFNQIRDSRLEIFAPKREQLSNVQKKDSKAPEIHQTESNATAVNNNVPENEPKLTFNREDPNRSEKERGIDLRSRYTALSQEPAPTLTGEMTVEALRPTTTECSSLSPEPATILTGDISVERVFITTPFLTKNRDDIER